MVTRVVGCAWALASALGCGPHLLSGDAGASDGSGDAGETDGSSRGSGEGEGEGEGVGDTVTGLAESGETGVPEPPPVEQQWSVEIDTPAPLDAFCDVAVLPNGTIAASGTSADDINAGTIGGAGWIARITGDGALLGVVDLSPDHAPLSLSVDPAGRLFIVGTRGIYPDTAEHFFALWDLDVGPEWTLADDTNWGFATCNSGSSGHADSEALADGMLVARYERSGSRARVFTPLGEIVTELHVGGSIDGLRTVAATGPDTFAVLGERAPGPQAADDWAVVRYDSAGTALWEQTGDGFPGELLATSSDLWHFLATPAEINRHDVTNGAFASASPPVDLAPNSPVALWAGDIVTLTEADVLTGYTTDLQPSWTLALDVPPAGARRLVAGSDGALYVTVDAWMTRVVHD
jgi:hypothetical protein